MKYYGRVSSICLCLLIQAFYAIYFYFPDGQVDPVIWYSTPVILAILYWAGRHYDRALFYAERDPLTNLYNRRFVARSFEKIQSVALRAKSQVFVILIDCDNFKQINDQYHHHTGDKILRQIGQMLVSNTRRSDLVARWGGDEFLIIGHYKDTAGLVTLLNRMQAKCEDLSSSNGFPISLSIGWAISSSEQHQSIEELIQIADQNMYFFKSEKSNNAAN